MAHLTRRSTAEYLLVRDFDRSGVQAIDDEDGGVTRKRSSWVAETLAIPMVREVPCRANAPQETLEKSNSTGARSSIFFHFFCLLV